MSAPNTPSERLSAETVATTNGVKAPSRGRTKTELEAEIDRLRSVIDELISGRVPRTTEVLFRVVWVQPKTGQVFADMPVKSLGTAMKNRNGRATCGGSKLKADQTEAWVEKATLIWERMDEI